MNTRRFGFAMIIRLSARNDPMSKRRLFKISLILVGLIASTAMSEVILRLNFRDGEINGNYWGIGAFEQSDLAGYIHKPGFKGYAFRRHAFDSYVEINQEGLRQKDLQQQLSFPQKALILGDSFAFGLGVKEESNFSSLIRSVLNDSGVGIINGAQTGYSVRQESLLGAALVDRYKPAGVFLCMFPTNDVEDDYFAEYKNIDIRYGYRLKKDRHLPYSFFDYFRTHSFLWMFLESQWNQRQIKIQHNRFTKLARQNYATAIGPTMSALRDFREKCDQKKIVFAIVVLPSGQGAGRIFHDPVMAELKKENFLFLDLEDKGFNESDRFAVDGHWNEQGHKKAASFIAPFIEEKIGSPLNLHQK